MCFFFNNNNNYSLDVFFYPLSPQDSSLDDDDGYQVYTLNLHYSNKRTKFKVSSFLQKETKQEIDSTHQMVLEDRKMFIQVSI